jgi:hypothetical protein
MLAALVAPVFVACCGAWITYDQGRAVWYGERSSAWPRVRGIVRGVAIGGSSLPLGRGASVLAATPVVRYEYWVAGKKYDSSRVNWTGFSGQAAIDQYLAYQKRAHVEVFYDPAAPANAVLEPGASTSAWGRVVLGICILILGIAWAIPAWSVQPV